MPRLWNGPAKNKEISAGQMWWSASTPSKSIDRIYILLHANATKKCFPKPPGKQCRREGPCLTKWENIIGYGLQNTAASPPPPAHLVVQHGGGGRRRVVEGEVPNEQRIKAARLGAKEEMARRRGGGGGGGCAQAVRECGERLASSIVHLHDMAVGGEAERRNTRHIRVSGCVRVCMW